MSDGWNVDGCLDDYPLDEDYIDVGDSKRADVTMDRDVAEKRETDGSTSQTHPSLAHTFNKEANGMSGTEIDELIDHRDRTDRADCTGARTGFDSEEASGFYNRKVKRDGYARTYAKWLRLLHDGYRSNEYRQNNYDEDKQRWIDALSSELELSPYQKERIEHIISDINMRYMAFYNTELVILAITTLVARHDGRPIDDEDAFMDCVADTDSSERDLYNAIDLVTRKTDRIDSVDGI